MKTFSKRGYRPRPKLDEISFVIASYRPDDDFPVAHLPDSCPYLEEAPEKPCVVHFHHLRDRKTGAVPVIVVCECLTHGHAFSLYPPGGVPYGRVRWSPVGPGGEAVHVVAEEVPGEAGGKLCAKVRDFIPTYPGAAVDERRGVLWPTGASWQDPPGTTQPRRETQVRRSFRTLQVLGVDGSAMDEDERLQVSEVLGIPLGKLEALEKELLPQGLNGCPRARGLAACKALEALPEVAPTCLAHRLAMAGYLAGIWGLPWNFDANRGTFTTEPFRRDGREVVAM